MNKISVIVPCFNGGKTLNRCLDSILAQTYKNFELFVIDDGSHDDSIGIIKEYCLKDSRVNLIEKPNGGVGSARNLGLARATGDFIQLVDCDDDIHPKMFETMLAKIEETGCDIAVCRFSHTCFRAFLPAGIYDMRDKEDFSKFYLDFFSFNVPWNKLYRRKVVTETFDETLKIFEDGLFVLSTLKNADKIVLLDDVFYYYYNPAAEVQAGKTSSAVNNFLKTKFWKTKDGYWFKFNDIKSFFDKSLKSGRFFDKVLEHARSFDMAFWELLKLVDSGCSEKVCILEMLSVLNQPNFIKSVNARRRRNMTAQGMSKYWGMSRRKVYDFVSKCFNHYRLNPDLHIGMMYDKFVEIFYDTCMATSPFLLTLSTPIFNLSTPIFNLSTPIFNEESENDFLFAPLPADA